MPAPVKACRRAVCWHPNLVTNVLEPRLAFARPGAPALEWLARTVAELKADNPLAPVTIVPPNMPAGTMALRRLARGSGYANVRCMRLADVAASVARPWLAGREPLTPILESSAARAAAAGIEALRPLADHMALAQGLVQLFRELRRAEVDPVLEAGRMAKAAFDAYSDFRRLTVDLVDATDVRKLATELLNQAPDTPRELIEIGALVLLLPGRIDPADVELLVALARRIPLAAVFANVQDPLELGQQRAADDCGWLARALGVDPPEAPPQPASLSLPPETSIARVPDTAEEAREVTRGIVAAMEQGLPLPRIAVLYRQPETYGQLLRDALDLAGLPWYSLSGTSLLESRPGQVLVELLRLPERSFGREAVLRAIAGSPAFTQAGLPSAATWERASREANVVRGADQWATRLRGYADKRQATIEGAVATEEDPHLAFPSPTQTAKAVGEEPRRMAAAIEDMARALSPPRDGSSWQSFAVWAGQAFDSFCGLPGLWPEEERPFAQDVRATLEELAAAGRFDAAATLPLFLTALHDALSSTTRPAGQPGNGVVIGPVQSVTGMSFDVLFLVGMNEGAFPPAPAIDPFFPSEAEDPLGLQTRQRQRERETFLTAVSAASQRLVLSTTQAADGRVAFPSPWLLEAASTLMEGARLNATAFAALRPVQHDWLRVVRSAQEGVAGATPPADLEDRRLAEASRWTSGARRELGAHALARRSDLPLGRALAMMAARRSAELTEFDGNVSVLAGEAAAIAQLFNGERAMSATAVQEWASCPFSYFLDRVLRIRGSEAPEDCRARDVGTRHPGGVSAPPIQRRATAGGAPLRRGRSPAAARDRGAAVRGVADQRAGGQPAGLGGRRRRRVGRPGNVPPRGRGLAGRAWLGASRLRAIVRLRRAGILAAAGSRS